MINHGTGEKTPEPETDDSVKVIGRWAESRLGSAGLDMATNDRIQKAEL